MRKKIYKIYCSGWLINLYFFSKPNNMQRIVFAGKEINLEIYRFHGNGNELYRIPINDETYILKHFLDRHGRFYSYIKSAGAYLAGKTSFLPEKRRQTELECVELWRNKGFNTFDVVDVEIEGIPEDRVIVYKSVKGKLLKDFIASEEFPCLWKLFVDELKNRHEIAERERESKLIHENADLSHVMLAENKLYYFDFEVCYTSKNIREIIARELLGYLKSLRRHVGEDKFIEYLDMLFSLYPKNNLEETYTTMFRNRKLVVRFGRLLDRMFSKRATKPHSKYNIARKIKQRRLNHNKPCLFS